MADKELRKRYSPDIEVYGMEGQSGLFNTILSLIVGPIRLVTRVMHNVFILPANLLEDYAMGLIYCSTVLGVLGVIDLIVAKRWPLLVSQVIPLFYGMRLKRQAHRSTIKAREKREVEIDVEEVEALCETVYTEIENQMEAMK